jgi:hypothetical protein
MTRLRILRLSAIGLLVAGTLATAQGQDRGYAFRFESIHVEDHLQQRAGTLAAALGFSAWPQPTELITAPPVTRSLLGESATLVADEVRSCGSVRFGNEPWGHCTWSWNARSAGRKQASVGSLDLEITLAPDSRGAQEYLLAGMANNMLPTEGLVAINRTAKRPPGLGTVSFLLESRSGADVRIWFTRQNVAVRLRGSRALSREILPLAQHLDELLLAQQPLTLEQLRARRPAIRLGTNAEGGALTYQVTVPGDREVLVVQARVDGKTVPAADGKVVLVARKGSVDVEVVSVTADLVAGFAQVSVRPAD